jgi:sterol desaturase/sphingolipid hydroxylase (fatty acid hydroxylase superfamily)
MGEVIFSSLTASMIFGKQVHICTHLLWTVMRISENLDGHCGYEFTWSPYRLLPFSTSAEYHDYHHLYNIGNYSSLLTLWDSVYGTNVAYFKHKEQEHNKI